MISPTQMLGLISSGEIDRTCMYITHNFNKIECSLKLSQETLTPLLKYWRKAN